MRRSFTTLLCVPVVAVLAFTAAGCGSNDEGAEQWANDVCTELGTWASSITTTITNVMAQGRSVTRTDLRAAANQASAATNRLVDGLQEIGPPDVDSGEEARDEVEQLGDDLRQHADKVKSLAENTPTSVAGAVELGQSVLAEVGAAADEAQATLDSLKVVSDDLRDGIEASSACRDLKNRDFAVG